MGPALSQRQLAHSAGLLAAGALAVCLSGCADYEKGEIAYGGPQHAIVEACVEISLQAASPDLLITGSNALDIVVVPHSGSARIAHAEVTGTTELRLSDGSGQINHRTCTTTIDTVEGHLDARITLDSIDPVPENFRFSR